MLEFFCLLAGLTLLDAGQMFGLVLLVISVINLFWMLLNT